jgi:hypothetical protein
MGHFLGHVGSARCLNVERPVFSATLVWQVVQWVRKARCRVRKVTGFSNTHLHFWQLPTKRTATATATEKVKTLKHQRADHDFAEASDRNTTSVVGLDGLRDQNALGRDGLNTFARADRTQ